MKGDEGERRLASELELEWQSEGVLEVRRVGMGGVIMPSWDNVLDADAWDDRLRRMLGGTGASWCAR